MIADILLLHNFVSFFNTGGLEYYALHVWSTLWGYNVDVDALITVLQDHLLAWVLGLHLFADDKSSNHKDCGLLVVRNVSVISLYLSKD